MSAISAKSSSIGASSTKRCCLRSITFPMTATSDRRIVSSISTERHDRPASGRSSDTAPAPRYWVAS